MAMEIWHNPRCSKSRATLEILEEAGVDLRVRRYLDEPPSVEELDRTLERLGVAPVQITRLKEKVAKELDLAGRDPERREWLRILHENPILIQRPVVIADDGRAVIGRPPENVEELL